MSWSISVSIYRKAIKLKQIQSNKIKAYQHLNEEPLQMSSGTELKGKYR